MGKRLLLLASLALLVLGGASGSASGGRSALGRLPARGVAIATAHATIFLDFQGRELGRLPQSYGLSRGPHGELILSSSANAWVLRPETGALASFKRQAIAAPAWARRPGCRGQAVHGSTWYLACAEGIVAIAHGKSATTVAAAPTGEDHEWVEIAPSPDGRTLLANQSRECDSRHAYVLPAAGGAARSLVASDASFGVGWTGSGEAVVWLPHGACSGKPARPGVYAIGLHGGRRTLAGSAVVAAATWGS